MIALKLSTELIVIIGIVIESNPYWVGIASRVRYKTFIQKEQ